MLYICGYYALYFVEARQPVATEVDAPVSLDPARDAMLLPRANTLRLREFYRVPPIYV